ncbi:MAG: magnesium transporter [Clostridiales bacterium]|nr:magnesium transporter [Clostridiales bacterium]
MNIEINMEELKELVKDKEFRKLKFLLERMNEADVAEFLEELPMQQSVLVFRMLPKSTASDVFAFLPVEIQKEIILAITDKELQTIVEDLYMDDVVDMLEELPASVVRRVLENATPETRKTINQFLNYPENSAGSIMTAEYISLKRGMTVSQSFDYIRAHGQDKETIYVLYVTDAERHLEGVVTVKDLLMHGYEVPIEELMDVNVISCVTTDDQEDAANLMKKYDLLSLAVVDTEDRLVGLITVDDAVDVMQQEATEDMEKMAAMLPSERAYLKTSVFDTWKARIPWLMLLMISATFTGAIIDSFEDALAVCTVLTGFIPMLMDTGGNSGSQASVSVIRGLSLKEIEFDDLFRVIWKEIRVAVLCGFTLACVNFVKILVVDKMLMGREGITLMVDAVVCATLMLTIICAKCIGCILPMLADRLGFDPAVMASPFITTLVDAVSLLIYFQLASAALGF